jgi:hypothetical protein
VSRSFATWSRANDINSGREYTLSIIYPTEIRKWGGFSLVVTCADCNYIRDNGWHTKTLTLIVPGGRDHKNIILDAGSDCPSYKIINSARPSRYARSNVNDVRSFTESKVDRMRKCSRLQHARRVVDCRNVDSPAARCYSFHHGAVLSQDHTCNVRCVLDGFWNKALAVGPVAFDSYEVGP